MLSKSTTIIRYGALFRLMVLVTITVFFNGCFTGKLVGKTAQGDPKTVRTFVLTAFEKEYELLIYWGAGADDYKTLTIPRNDLPEGCRTARFFIVGLSRELRIAEPKLISSKWLTWDHPSFPDSSYPQCSLLVSYGTFTEEQKFEGLVVTSSSEVIAKLEFQQAHPAAWVVAPGAIVADTAIFLGALITMPVWGPYGYIEASKQSKLFEELPPSIKACKSAIDTRIKSFDSNKFSFFEWSPSKDNAYSINESKDLFSEEQNVLIDTRVTLHGGSLYLSRYLGQRTGVDIECGLESGNVVATSISLIK